MPNRRPTLPKTRLAGTKRRFPPELREGQEVTGTPLCHRAFPRGSAICAPAPALAPSVRKVQLARQSRALRAANNKQQGLEFRCLDELARAPSAAPSRK